MDNNLMNKVDNKKIAVGLDIGTTKICALVIENTGNGTYNILSCATTENTGVNRGVIVNIDKTVENIKKVVTAAEQQSGTKITEVVAGLAGDHIESSSEVCTITISNKSQVVSQSDISRIIDELSRTKISADRKIIHIVPYEYIIDGQDGIINPIGMYGVRLQANVHIVSGLNTAIQNVYRCVEKGADIKIKDIVLEPIASSKALLAEDEQEVGVCLIDIGGGTTDITIFKDNVLRYTTIVGLGGNKITKDIKEIFKITAAEAERIKCTAGHTFQPTLMRGNEAVIMRTAGGNEPVETTKEDLCLAIQPRMEELLEICTEEMLKSGFSAHLGAGVVLTGGSTLLAGTENLARRIFNTPVRVGYPLGDKYKGLAETIESPKYSTAVGLALLSLETDANNSLDASKNSADEAQDSLNEDNNSLDKTKKRASKTLQSGTKSPAQIEKSKSFVEKAKDFLTKL